MQIVDLGSDVGVGIDVGENEIVRQCLRIVPVALLGVFDRLAGLRQHRQRQQHRHDADSERRAHALGHRNRQALGLARPAEQDSAEVGKQPPDEQRREGDHHDVVARPQRPAAVGEQGDIRSDHSNGEQRLALHYLLLPAFALYFLRGTGQGLWAEMADVNRRDFGFYYIGRLYSAVRGAATSALVYVAAKKMWPGDRGRWAGVMATVLLAFSFVHVRESQNAVTNAPMAFFVVVAFLAVLAVYQGGSMRSYALAGFLCGIAVATKLSALAIPARLSAHAPRNGHPPWSAKP